MKSVTTVFIDKYETTTVHVFSEKDNILSDTPEHQAPTLSRGIRRNSEPCLRKTLPEDTNI